MFLFEKQNMQNKAVLWGQFQSSSVGSRTKATLPLPAMAVQSSHVCHGMKTCAEDLSYLSPGGFSQRLRKPGDTECLQIILREIHIGLMRIWRWEKVRGALSSSQVGLLCDVPCGGFRGSALALLQRLCLFYLPVSLWFFLSDSCPVIRGGDTSLRVAPSACEDCWELEQLWADVPSTCTWSQTNAGVLPKHMGGAVAVDLLYCCFTYCLVILKRLWNAMQSLELGKEKGLASYCRACRSKRE